MVICSIAEAIAGSRHAFFSFRTGHTSAATYLGAGMSVLYIFAGTLVLTAKKSAAAMALCILAAVILGHVAMVITELYPADSVPQLFAITLATSVACAFFVLIAMKWDSFV
jgi:FtsH-binding integral membrane protein